MTWAIIIGLLVVGAFASAVWPTISAQLNGRSTASLREEAKPIVINIESYLMGKEIMGILGDVSPDLLDTVNENLNGREISQPIAIGILIALSLGGLVLLTGPIALIYTRLEKQASTVKEDETYQLAVSALEKRQTAEIKAMQQANPGRINDDPVEDRRGFSYTMAFLGIGFAWVIGVVLGRAAFGGDLVESGGKLINPVSIVSLIAVVIAVAAFFLYFRFIRKPEEIDLTQTDYSPVSWGWLWVIVSGLLIVGIGTGLAITLSSGGPPAG
jgi:hypothetical protein